MYLLIQVAIDQGYSSVPIAIWCAVQGEQGDEMAANAANSELKLTETAIRKNPKSYAAWHHRKWLVALGVAPLDNELQLVTK